MKQKTGRKLLGVLLALAMVIGLFPGMSLTAYAAMDQNKTFKVGDMIHSGFPMEWIRFGDENNTRKQVDDCTIQSITYNETSGKWVVSVQGVPWEAPFNLAFPSQTGKVFVGLKLASTSGNPITNGYYQLAAVYEDAPTFAVIGVTLNKTSTTLTVGGTETLTATVSPDNATDKTVTWSSDNEFIATVADGVVTAVAAGTANITVTTTDGSKTATCAVTVNKADPTAPTGLNATYGQTLADVTLPDGWTWADSTQSVGSVVSPAATFKANFAGNDNYNAASDVDVTVTVSKAANPATVAGTATVTKGGNTVDLVGNVTLNGATGEVTYAIDGEANGCTLSGSMLTSGDNTGSVTVNVSVAADNNYNALAATPITVTISDKGTQTITASDVTATYGDTNKKVEATTDGNGAISYTVKDGSADYIDVDASTGTLTIKKVGTATVIVTAAETGTYAQATKEVTVTINKANAVAATVTANNHTYDGTDKPLVNVDNSTLVGGEMQYALGTETEATQPYTTSIPSKTNAGTYYDIILSKL